MQIFSNQLRTIFEKTLALLVGVGMVASLALPLGARADDAGAVSAVTAQTVPLADPGVTTDAETATASSDISSDKTSGTVQDKLSPKTATPTSAGSASDGATSNDATVPTNSAKVSPKQTSDASSGGTSTTQPSQGQLSLTSDTAMPRVNATTGALTEHIPLDIPPGRAGLTPDLALDYNSQNPRDGIVGYGWSLSIPFIERLNKTGSDHLYSDGYFTSSLDGELATTSTAGKYLARLDQGDARVYMYANNTWTVYDKKGTQYLFGKTTQSREFVVDTATSTDKWMLEKVTDANGNTITYSYVREGNQLYPSSILYTGHGTDQGIFKITFVKTARPDTSVRYEGGVKVVMTSRITEVDAFVQGKQRQAYVFGYKTGSNGYRSLLASVTETGFDSAGGKTQLPPMIFSYTSSISTYQRRADTGGGTPTQYSLLGPAQVAADINGDGLPDKATLFQDSTSLSTGFQGYINQNGSLPQSPAQTSGSPEYFAVTGGTYPNPFVFYESGTRLVDVDADGKAEVVRGELIQDFPSQTSRIRTWQNLYTNVSSPQAISYSGTMPMIALGRYSSGGGSTWNTGLFGNINGDSFPDFVHASSNGFNMPGTLDGLYEGNGNGFNYASSTYAPVTQVTPVTYQPSPAQLLDINGDGLDDWMYSDGSNTKFCLNTGTDWNCDDTRWNLATSTYWGRDGYDRGMRFIDMNGDGLLDFVRSYNVPAHGLPYGWTSDDDTETATVNLVMLNTGSGFATSTLQVPGWITYLDPYSGSAFTGSLTYDELVDWDGNGIPDSSNYLGVGERQDYLNKIQYPDGGTITVAYMPSTAVQAQTNPDLPIFVHAVAQIITNDGAGNQGVTAYTYSGGKMYLGNVLDHTFAGFKTVVETRGDRVTTTYYHQGDDADAASGEAVDSFSRIGHPYRVDVANTNGVTLLSTYTKWDEYARPGTNSVLVVPGQVVERSFDLSGNHQDKVVAYAYDANTGNVTTKTEYGSASFSPPSSFTDMGNDKYITTYTYAAAPAINLTVESGEVLKSQSGTTVEEKHFYYDNKTLGSVSVGNPTKVEQRIDTTTFASTTAAFNAYGMPIQTQDADSNTTVYAYDPLYLYVASSTNALAQITSYTYDYSSGHTTSVTDPNGEVTTYKYNGLGRLTEKDVPDPQTGQSVVQTTNVYVDTANAVSVHTSNYLDASTVAETYAYEDGFGRVVQQKTENTGGTWSTVDLVYDAFGRLVNLSLPYTSNTYTRTGRTTVGALYHAYSYDPLDRETTDTTVLGSTRTGYGPWNQTVTDPLGEVSTDYKDAYGNLIQIDEHLSTTTLSTRYGYERYGGTFRLVSLQDAASNTRSFSYDVLGRETRATGLAKSGDSTVSYRAYTYDPVGNRLTMQDPITTVDYSYDPLNRLAQENDRATSVVDASYTYDSCAHGTGRLCAQTSRSGSQAVTETRAYTPGGLVKTSTKTILGKPYSASYTYDRQGNTLTIQNPDNSVIKYTYDGGNKPTRVDLVESGSTSTAIATGISYQPTGAVSALTYGNGVSTCYTYDPNALYRLTYIRTTAPGYSCTQNPTPLTSVSSTTTKYNMLQGLAYTYDADGNVKTLVENAQTPLTRSEAYTYDTLNRLTQTKVTIGTTTQASNFSYDALGNLLTLGTTAYQYMVPSGYQNPDAPTTVGGVGYSYDAIGDLTAMGSTTLSYDYAGRLLSYSSAKTKNTFLYDPTGARAALIAGTATTTYAFATYDSVSGKALKHVPLGEVMVADVFGSGASSTPQYIHSDLLGSTNIVSNGSGTPAEFLEYSSYGAPQVDQKAGGAPSESREYIGQYYDSGSGLSYLNARYYDPGRGQFLSEDPVFLSDPLKQNLANPQTLNSYSYGNGNPTTNRDPQGLYSAVAVIRNLVEKTIGLSNETAAFAQELVYNEPSLSQNIARGTFNMLSNLPQVVSSLGSAAIFGTQNTLSDIASNDEARQDRGVASALMGIGSILAPEEKIAEIPDEAIIVRGGGLANQTEASFAKTLANSRVHGINGFSVQCNGGCDIAQLAQFLPNPMVSITTVGEVRALGGIVMPTPGRGFHATVLNLDPVPASSLSWTEHMNAKPLKK